MELLCGKCLINMNQLKKKEISKEDWSKVEQKVSMKCPECGHIVVATWKANIVYRKNLNLYP